MAFPIFFCSRENRSYESGASLLGACQIQTRNQKKNRPHPKPMCKTQHNRGKAPLSIKGGSYCSVKQSTCPVAVGKGLIISSHTKQKVEKTSPKRLARWDVHQMSAWLRKRLSSKSCSTRGQLRLSALMLDLQTRLAVQM